MTSAASPPAVASVRRRPSGEPAPLRRRRDPGALVVALAAAVCLVVWLAAVLSPAVAGLALRLDDELMRSVEGARSQALSSVAVPVYDLGARWFVPLLGWSSLVVLAVFQRWRRTAAYPLALAACGLVAHGMALVAGRPRPLHVEILGPWAGFSHPSTTVALFVAAAVGSVICLVPRERRRAAWTLAAVVAALFATVEVYLAVSHPTDVLVGAIVGAALVYLMLELIVPAADFPVSYERGNPAHLDLGGARGDAIRRALRDQLGLSVTEIRPIGLSGSAGSSPMLLTAEDGPGPTAQRYFAKLLAQSHLSSDRSYKFFRTLLYGRLEDEWSYNSVRRLAEHEDYMSMRMAEAGIRVPRSLGLVELDPEREYLVVTEFLEGYREIGEAEVTEAVIDGALAMVRKLWNAGIAHRDIKPANVMVRGDEVALIDTGFCEMRPSPWRQAVDLGNLLLLLSLRSDPETVLVRARAQFGPEEISEALSAAHGVAVPTQLRAALKADGRPIVNVLDDLAGPLRPVAIQTWSRRRVGLLLLVGATAVFLAALGADLLRMAGMLP